MPNCWYDCVSDNTLEQGDLLYNFPAIKADLTAEHIKKFLSGAPPDLDAEVELVDAIILTQSCDLVNNKTDSVILCPVWDHEIGKLAKKEMNDIRNGYRFGLHLLNAHSELDIPFTIVEFRRLFTAKKTAVIEFVSNGGARPRLISPYKEHLSQAFARYFMRVGLPSDIPPF